VRQSRRLAHTGVGKCRHRMAWKVPGRGLGSRLRVNDELAQEGLATGRESLRSGIIASSWPGRGLCPRLRAERIRSTRDRGPAIYSAICPAISWIANSRKHAAETHRLRPTHPGHVGRKRNLAQRADQLALVCAGFEQARRHPTNGAGLWAGKSGKPERELGQAERSARRFKRRYVAEGI